jgi:hypothetical protein
MNLVLWMVRGVALQRALRVVARPWVPALVYVRNVSINLFNIYCNVCDSKTRKT